MAATRTVKGGEHAGGFVIEARALTKRYGSATALDEVTFTVPPGKVTGFLGPNGSGKSTTMRIIMGLDHPTSGEGRINGRRYRDLPWPLREAGALLDTRGFHPGRRADHHLAALARANRIPLRRVEDVLESVGLARVARRRTKTFSLGMCQRLGLAAAMLGDPGVLLLDEPVNGLDPEGIAWLRALLRSLADEGRTVLVSSHLIGEMALVADHLVIIGRGRLVAETSVRELIARSGRETTKVRSPDTASLASLLTAGGALVAETEDRALSVAGIPARGIAELAASHGVVLEELSPMTPSLEAAYLALTRDQLEYEGASR